MSEITILGGEVKTRPFPKTFHSAGFKEYYDKARIFLKIKQYKTDEGSPVINPTEEVRNSGAIQQGLQLLGLDDTIKCVWSSKKECFIVQSLSDSVRSKDVTVTIQIGGKNKDAS